MPLAASSHFLLLATRILEQAGGTQGALLPDSALEDGKPQERRVYAKPVGARAAMWCPIEHRYLLFYSTVLSVAALSVVLRSSAGGAGASSPEQDTSALEAVEIDVGG